MMYVIPYLFSTTNGIVFKLENILNNFHATFVKVEVMFYENSEHIYSQTNEHICRRNIDGMMSSDRIMALCPPKLNEIEIVMLNGTNLFFCMFDLIY